jgi:hypothetical protein
MRKDGLSKVHGGHKVEFERSGDGLKRLVLGGGDSGDATCSVDQQGRWTEFRDHARDHLGPGHRVKKVARDRFAIELIGQGVKAIGAAGHKCDACSRRAKAASNGHAKP